MQAIDQARYESLAHLLNPIQLVRGLWGHRELVAQLTRREVAMRYRGAYLGILWSFITPMIMLAIYTFVFRVIFNSHWREGEPAGFFALILFAGLIPFTVFAETANRSSHLILSVPSYVKKVVFPLEILPFVSVMSAVVHSLISVAILLVGAGVLTKSISPVIWMLPLAYLPLMLLCLAMAWLLASLGMYLRDIGHGIALVVVALNFLSPIFYPPQRVPEYLRGVYQLNPLTTIVSTFRSALLGEGAIDWPAWAICTIASAMLAMAGYAWFMKTKKGFADVI